MTPDQVLASLVELAKRTGIRVRFDERMTADGGLCMVRGQPLVVLDAQSPPAAQAEILASALARFGVLPLYVPRPRAKRFALRD